MRVVSPCGALAVHRGRSSDAGRSVGGAGTRTPMKPLTRPKKAGGAPPPLVGSTKEPPPAPSTLPADK
jgi:hypothetical protein